MLVICAWCHRQTRRGGGPWKQDTVTPADEHTASHGICPACYARVAPSFGVPPAMESSVTKAEA